jgi:L-alanine-DL-glutamate epimerase-like enolase superfamily enzyme
MKKFIMFTILAGLVVLFTGKTTYAAIEIKTGNSANGIIAIEMAEADLKGKAIMVLVEKIEGGKTVDKYQYQVIRTAINIPLNMGTGDYKVTVLEGIGGGKFKPLKSVNVKAATINELEMFIASIPIIEFNASITAIPAMQKLIEGKKNHRRRN